MDERTPAVKVENVSVLFNLNKEKIDNLKEYFIKLITRKLHYTEFWALTDVSFEIAKGEVEVDGVIAPMLELGAGFDMNYSGRENVFLYGATMGYSRKFIQQKYDEIVAFSELEEFMDVPVKNYSSGMRARLGFSIATAVQPEVLILDEVLSVGDAKFRKKSEAKIRSMFDQGVTVLFVSHNTEQVRRLCTKAILLQKGKLIASGTAEEVCDIYDEMVEQNKK
jgi:ABC-2 type transport system ATP-binding protein